MFPSPLGEVGSLMLAVELSVDLVKFPSPLGEVGSLMVSEQTKNHCENVSVPSRGSGFLNAAESIGVSVDACFRPLSGKWVP